MLPYAGNGAPAHGFVNIQHRATIFNLHDATADTRLRSRIKAVVEELELVVGTDLELVWSGPLDTLVDSGLVTDVEAVVREAMTNVAWHAQASTLGVMINAGRDRLTIDVRRWGGSVFTRAPGAVAWLTSATVLTVAVAR